MTSPSSSPSPAHKSNGPFLQRVANLSNVLTLVALIALGYGAAQKLDNIESHAQTNCRAINAGIVLTLESSRAALKTNRQQNDLDRTVARFQSLQSQC